MYVHGVEINNAYDPIAIKLSGMVLRSERIFLDNSATYTPVVDIINLVNMGPRNNNPFNPKKNLINAWNLIQVD